MPAPKADDISGQITQWRRMMAARPGLSDDDVDELTDHLESEINDLRTVGLTPDEAFLIAVKRLGGQDAVSREYARVHSDRLWRQLVPPSPARRQSNGLLLTLILATGCGLAVRLPYTFLGEAASGEFYPRAIGLLILPLLIGYFLIGHWRDEIELPHRVDRLGGVGGLVTMAGVLAVAAVPVALFPARPDSQTFWLTALHLPVSLGIATGIAYLGARWTDLSAWMDWVRFLGEAAVYYVLIALCGGVLTALIVGIFYAAGLPETAVSQIPGWVLPLGAGGAVPVCAWLVQHKKSVIENMAPVLTAVFTPLMSAALIAFLVVVVVAGDPVTVDRDVLIVFDAALIAVAAIVLFTVSARDAERRHVLDWMQLILIAAAICVDLVMLWAMAGRLGEWGASANKLAGLGCNVLLLTHLAGSAWHYCQILLGRAPRPAGASGLARWQCLALPVFGVWALLIALGFPPLFGWA
ncbi:permease prefix domain 1-containing protein [Acidipropionibacterium virtanenii]|nr:permease prefix domain 1-containing protein [Acidipropionibacterium virtanenii]